MSIANEVIARVRDLIQDIEAARYTDTELLRWIDDGQMETVRIAPRAYSGFVDMPMTAGSIQTIPSTAVRLIKVFCNGSLADQQKSPTETTMVTLDRADPQWRNEDATAAFDHYVVGDDLETFHVYPPSNGASECVVEVGLKPAAVTDIFSTLSLADKYLPMLTNYVAARALSKDAEFVNESNQAKEYMKQFYEGLAATVQTTSRAS